MCDETGKAYIPDPLERQKFLDRKITVADYLDECDRVMLSTELHDRLPEGELAGGVATAISTVLNRLQEYSREGSIT